jgi:hypothetical protein
MSYEGPEPVGFSDGLCGGDLPPLQLPQKGRTSIVPIAATG